LYGVRPITAACKEKVANKVKVAASFAKGRQTTDEALEPGDAGTGAGSLITYDVPK
jgi:hypothetical protein